MLSIRVSGRTPFGADKAIAGAVKIIEEQLTETGFSGQWLLRIGDKVRQKGPQKFHVIGPVGRAVRLRVKPGDNGTTRVYDLVPPAIYDPQVVVERLQVEPVEATEEAPAAVQEIARGAAQSLAHLADTVAEVKEPAKLPENVADTIQRLTSHLQKAQTLVQGRAKVMQEMEKIDEQVSELQGTITQLSDQQMQEMERIDKEIAEHQERIAQLKERQTELLTEYENDKVGKQAEETIRTLSSLLNPSANGNG